MKPKKHARETMTITRHDIIRGVEEELIQMWDAGTISAPTSPLEAASLLAMQSVQCMNISPAIPSKKEFTAMLHYITDNYTFSPHFPYTNQQLKEDILTKTQEIQRRRDNT
jgi:hypothetical protein